MEVIAARSFNTLYIYLDLVWLVFVGYLLFRQQRHLAIFVGLAAGVIYFIVDYGGFYLLLDTRVVQGADPFWFLLWLSFSYGFTNFAWIWLLLDKDNYRIEWSLLIIGGWLGIAFVSQNFGARFPTIDIHRGTGAYHGVMALILVIGYTLLIIRNLQLPKNTQHHVDLLRLLIIGIGVQFSWEVVLLISGIRPQGIMPLVVNSLIETNLGMPYIYLIHRTITARIKT